MNLVEIWESLQARAAVDTRWLFTRVETQAPCGLLVAVRKPENELALLVEVPSSAVETQLELRDCAGYRVETESAAPGRSGTVRYCVVLQRIELTTIFCFVVNDIVMHVAESANSVVALKAFARRLAIWREFFRATDGGILSLQAQRGLFGELTLLRSHILPVLGVELAVSSWSGGAGVQDFAVGGLAIEVKSTVSQPRAPFHVGSLEQLDEAGLDSLVLAHVQLMVREDGASLNELINDIRILASSASATCTSILADLLLQAGYLDTHSGRYLERYNVITVRLFEVRDDFPRIVSADVRPGVVAASYAIDLDFCVDYELARLPLVAGDGHG